MSEVPTHRRTPSVPAKDASSGTSLEKPKHRRTKTDPTGTATTKVGRFFPDYLGYFFDRFPRGIMKGSKNSKMDAGERADLPSSKVVPINTPIVQDASGMKSSVENTSTSTVQGRMEKLRALRASTGRARTKGLPDETIERFLAAHPDLGTAIDWAAEAFERVEAETPHLAAMNEPEALASLQAGFVNFYPPDAVNPFVSLAGKGPWIVTLHGAVVHDSGGYGMLGFGHEPGPVRDALAVRQVMANIMTGNVAQTRFVEALRREIGHSRHRPITGSGGDGESEPSSCPYDRFLCMNSGSEAMSVASRISDAHAKRVTDDDDKDDGGTLAGTGTTSGTRRRHAGKTKCVYVALERGFHGRTLVPASFSDSTRPHAERHLASFRGWDNLWAVPANDVDALRAAFVRAEAEGVFIQMVVIEPVQGEGEPGLAITREFYDEARRLTLEHDAFFVVDSIQAGLRAWGTLSIVDYPGFEDCAPPDMEAWSKALNAGQFPLSVLGLTERAASEYVVGLYGNTMTTNPRALDVACAVLGMVTPEVRQNVRDQGHNFVDDLLRLKEEFPDIITEVRGTGLLFSVELNPDRARSLGPGSAEERCRMQGVGIIHGGKNALRFTPHLCVTDLERELIVSTLRSVLTEIEAESKLSENNI